MRRLPQGCEEPGARNSAGKRSRCADATLRLSRPTRTVDARHCTQDRSRLPRDCQDCHGGAHEVLAAGDPKSPVNHANIPYTCGRCHGQRFLMESNGASAQTFSPTRRACTGARLRTGRRRPPCAPIAMARMRFCRPTMHNSPIYKFNVPATCGKCHADVDTDLHAEHSRAGACAWQPDGAGVH